MSGYLLEFSIGGGHPETDMISQSCRGGDPGGCPYNGQLASQAPVASDTREASYFLS